MTPTPSRYSRCVQPNKVNSTEFHCDVQRRLDFVHSLLSRPQPLSRIIYHYDDICNANLIPSSFISALCPITLWLFAMMKKWNVYRENVHSGGCFLQLVETTMTRLSMAPCGKNSSDQLRFRNYWNTPSLEELYLPYDKVILIVLRISVIIFSVIFE